MRSFAKRILDFIRYRNATRDMNNRYPDATAEEIAREDVCIICREEMQPWQTPESTQARATEGRTAGRVSERLRPKKLPCGHLLHFACLRSWLERQQNCPTCRRPVAAVGRGAAHEDGNAAGRPNQPGAPGGGRPRAWVLNLGPLRVGFGAGRGDQLQDIAHQLNAGQAPVDRAANSNRPMVNQQPPNLGLSSAHPGVTEPPTHMERVGIQHQILQLEQQINQEINSLLAASDQLQVVRLLQNELARLRAVNSNRALPGNLNDHQTNHQGASNASPFAFQSHSAPVSQLVSPASRYQALPEGISLPPGWTLIPLQDTQSENEYLNLPQNNAVLSSSHPPPLRDPTRMHLFPESPQPLSGSVASSSNPISTAMISRQEPSPNQDRRILDNKRSSQRPVSRTSSPAPSQDWTEVISDRIANETVQPNLQIDNPKDLPDDSHFEGESPLSPRSDGTYARKGKSKAATVEDFDE